MRVAAPRELTAAVWIPYTDRYGIIHSIPVNAARDPSTTNGLLFTAEACTIMQLRNVSYNRARIAAGVKADEVKPGLYRRSPVDRDEAEAPDDYVGLGALAGVCGFPDVARSILAYGNGNNQVSGPTVLGLYPNDFASLRDGLKQCQRVPYNYNNVDPKKFTLATWMGKFPAVITHWKLGAGERPTTYDFAIWSAALIFSGQQDFPGQDHWLQSWLMVLTYEMSPYHSKVADFAVTQWWGMLHKRYPIGIRQTMTEYLAAGAQGNPLAEYIEDFEQSRNPSAVIVDADDSAISLLGPLERLLSTNCARMGSFESCVDYSDFSPTNFLAPFTQALTASVAAVDETRRQVAMQQALISQHAAAVHLANDVIAGLGKGIADAQKQLSGFQQDVAAKVLQKADWLTKQLDKIPLPGHLEVLCLAPKVAGICLAPAPVFIPGGFKENPNFEALVQQIADENSRINALQNVVNQTQSQLAAAQRDLVTETDALGAASAGLNRLQEELGKAASTIEIARGALDFAQAILRNAIPCGQYVPIQ